MVQRTRFDESTCPVARSVDAIGDWWSLLIVRDAFDGSRRFGEFQRSLGVAKNIQRTMRTLVAGGILEVVPASDGSAYNEYVPTAKAATCSRDRRAAPVGRGALVRAGRAAVQAAGSSHGRPLRTLEVRAADGRRVRPEDTQVEKVPEHNEADRAG